MGRITAIEKALQERGARWSTVDEDRVVSDYGDPAEEYAAVMETGLAAIERGERETLVFHGEDAIPWLQGLVTSDLHALVDEGNGQRSAVVNTTGRFIGEARLMHLPQLLVADLEPGTLAGGLLSHLRGQIIREKVVVDDRSDATWRLGIYGERAGQMLAEFADWTHNLSTRAPFFGSWARWNGIDLFVQRTIWSDVLGFELSCAVEDGLAVLEGLENSVDALPLVGHQAFETLRIEAGVPRFGVELHDKAIPLEAGFEDAISFTKGCYLGQEIIARLDTLGTPAKMLRRLVIDGEEVPERGTKIYPADGGKRAIGSVESAADSPRFGSPVALAYIKRGHNEIGEPVRVGDDETMARLEDILDIRAISDE